MSIELIGLAYDLGGVDAVWGQQSLQESFWSILKDPFRRKVDFRSMLYHKGQLDLLIELESMLRRGGHHLTIQEFMALRFQSGVEESIAQTAVLDLDYQLIRYFTVVAMADDFLVADPFLTKLVQKMKGGSLDKNWSLLTCRDYTDLADILKDVRMSDIAEITKMMKSKRNRDISYENLVRNYIEFLSFATNNGFEVFLYNSHSSFSHWGNLIDRYNQRNELIVELAMKQEKELIQKLSGVTKQKTLKIDKKNEDDSEDLELRMKQKREIHSLVGGLNDLDPLIRQKAAESLSAFKAQEALPALIALLEDTEPEIRQEAVRAIGKVGTKPAVEALLRVLVHEENVSVRLSAAFCLVELGDLESLPVILDLVEQRKPLMTTLLGYHPAIKTWKPLVGRLKTWMTSEQTYLRLDASYLLGTLKLKGSDEALIEALASEKDEQVRAAIYWALQAFGSKKLNHEFFEAEEAGQPALVEALSVLRHVYAQ